jgi:hypothetical protein
MERAVHALEQQRAQMQHMQPYASQGSRSYSGWDMGLRAELIGQTVDAANSGKS